jgi:uncharacterized protein YecE (DUF72 family)
MSKVLVLAFDLGASGGRAIIGKVNLEFKSVEMEEIYRFPNGPVRVRGHLYWDVLRIWSEVKEGILRAYRSVDTKDFFIGWEPRGTWLQNKEKIIDVVTRFKSVIHVVDPFKTLPVVDKETTYFRLHGIGEKDVNYRYKYTQQDFEKLLKIIKIVKNKSSDIYILFNNIYMAQDAQEFKSMIKTLQI